MSHYNFKLLVNQFWQQMHHVRQYDQ